MLTQLAEKLTLRRECPGIMVPEGREVLLPAGSVVLLKQSLGGDYTVTTECGDVVRIAGEHADALGKAPQAGPAPAAEGPFEEEAALKALRSVYDPEIPVNIMDLGLVYESRFPPAPGGGRRAEIRMTLTAPGCGMGEVLRQDVIRKLRGVPGIEEVDVEIVFDPPWSQSMMSEAARLELGLF